MQQLVISKIEERRGVKYLECIISGLVCAQVDFENHPSFITFLGDLYVKVSWSESGTICYQTR